MNNLTEMTLDELQEVVGGDVKDVVTTVAGVCGGVVGFIAGFAVGYAGAGHWFTAPVSIPSGVITGAVGAVGGYAGVKTGAEAAWDVIATAISQ